MSETKTPAVPYLQQLLVDGQIWFCTEIFCQFSFCQEILIKLSGDTLNNLSNNLGSFRRILQGMGIYRQNIYYRACLWCGLRTLQRIFLHEQLWLKTFLRFELNFYTENTNINRQQALWTRSWALRIVFITHMQLGSS